MTPNSSDQLFESLSALVDNEANELEVRRILKNIETQPELLERWRRYHLISSALRKERSLHVSGARDLAAGIANAISGDMLYTETPAGDAKQLEHTAQTKASSWRDFIGKSAVAASFAAVLVLGVRLVGDTADTGSDALQLVDNAVQAKPEAVAFVANSAPLGFDVPVPEARTVSRNAQLTATQPMRVQPARQMDDMTDLATQQLLNQLLILHSERASINGSLGIMPFARISQLQSEAER